MSRGDKPRYSLTARERLERGAPKPAKQERIKIAGAWDGEYGVNVTLDKEVEFIQLKDGRRITPTSHWLDWKDWNEGSSRGRSVKQETSDGGYANESDDDSGLPF